MNEPEILRLESVTKTFDASGYPAVNRVSLNLPKGEILTLLGPSGCGKTTLLRLLAGFEKPDAGVIEIGGRQVAGGGVWIPPEHRQLGMVFQEYALFPHLTVAENVAFGLKKQQKQRIQQEVTEAIALVGLEGLSKRYPHQLSGGQRQRVALARAIAPAPAIVLLDEPLSNLDVQVRLYLREEIRKILKSTNTTAIFVTHDQEEALAISDRIAVMKKGRIEQFGTPEEIYEEPASRFVAGFVTQANFLPARRIGKLWETEVGSFAVEVPQAVMPEPVDTSNEGELMIREEDLILKPDETGEVVIRDRQFLGREHRYCLMTPSGLEFHARISGESLLAIGTRVQVAAIEERLRVFAMKGVG
ncbi:ABC transporter ATP-binding protein [Phormidium pseudopriestleyi FRX01]|uniref:ABC transporter ATP-binding protein n=1 Tax=Phormidium pseudopriestleyi FRX01 TaxID=1759528 RepID=A0ABS3FUD1_9CYAN|nr:ABC transporter ATP-binding protein [Phormidium pseudopriestleyi]MBO0350231.1 ABC transporter ATP-binding protein [Phormidium pseudopriestleyi FRX01]